LAEAEFRKALRFSVAALSIRHICFKLCHARIYREYGPNDSAAAIESFTKMDYSLDFIDMNQAP